jgi:hypothetical protein
MLNNRLITTIFLCLIAATPALAQEEGSRASASTIGLDVMLLVAGLLCLSACLKVFSLLKGGELSVGWQLLSVSFLVFSLGQILSLFVELDFFQLHRNAINVLQVAALFLVFFGVARIKKSLT